MMKRRIIVFTQPDSLPCEVVKLFLKNRRVKFDERNVAWDDDAVRELTEKYNSKSTPTVVVDDEVLVGFDPEGIDQLLRQA
jgi:glutaredoxin